MSGRYFSETMECGGSYRLNELIFREIDAAREGK
jgi:hypothetical protein